MAGFWIPAWQDSGFLHGWIPDSDGGIPDSCCMAEF